jgi:glucan phosphorylase
LQDIEQFKQIFDESGPPGTHRKETLLDFCMKAVMESAEFFIGNITNEVHLQRALAEETIRKLQHEIKEIKAEQKDKLETLESKLRKSEIEKAELGAKEQSSRELVQQLQSEKNLIENEMNSKFLQ